MKMMTKFLILALTVGVTLNARAQLKFEQTDIELHPTVSDENAVAHFKYKNTRLKTDPYQLGEHIMWLHGRDVEIQRRAAGRHGRDHGDVNHRESSPACNTRP